jgi:hypothetical protein
MPDDLYSPEFQAAFANDVRAHGQQMITLKVDFEVAFSLVAQLQVALRHPGNNGAQAIKMRLFVEALINRIAFTPTIRRVLEAGWKREHDVFVPPPNEDSQP